LAIDEQTIESIPPGRFDQEQIGLVPIFEDGYRRQQGSDIRH
jgi:hypothetical protein